MQGDPFASPSRIAVAINAKNAGLPPNSWNNRARRTATEDYLTRRVAEIIPRVFQGQRGSGKSGRVFIDKPGQEVLERTSCLIDEGSIEVRLEVGLPAAGRRVLGREAAAILCDELPTLVSKTLMHGAHDEAAIQTHADTVDDQQWLRAHLSEHELVAFVAEASILPRRSGVDDRPKTDNAVPFGPIPESLAVEITLPHRGVVRGLGIRPGVTLLVGGGYHGKSTLLDAIARGIYDHVPGDGRELVVTSASALSVRAEDGRRVSDVGIDAFINGLPSGDETTRFSTERASGSTSQAAGIMEGVEAGARVLLLDEDTSAGNFLVRDHRMQLLVSKEHEPITPYIDRVRDLHTQHGVSTLLVLGGCSDYFDVADCVIQMQAYRPLDVTPEVRQLCVEHPSPRSMESDNETVHVRHRIPDIRSIDPSSGRRPERVKSMDTRAIRFGNEEIDLSKLSQLVHPSQTRALADALLQVQREWGGENERVTDIVETFDALVSEEGLTAFTARSFGNRAAVRGLDVACALNRLRSLRIR
mgnify:CR=1 FL=1